MLVVNAELIQLYWDIGRLIAQRQEDEGWGGGVIPRLATDLRNELPKLKGFSPRNLGYMLQFAKEYGDPPAAQSLATASPSTGQTIAERAEDLDERLILQQLVAKIPWGHNILLLERVKDHPTRRWYMQQTLTQGWSRNTLATMINSRLHKRQGQSTNNFATQLPRRPPRQRNRSL